MKRLITTVFAIATILAGCTKAPLDEVAQTTQDYSAVRQAAENVYYPLETAQQAANEVLSTRGTYSPQLYPTSSYIVFHPKNSYELSLLLGMKGMEFSTRSALEDVSIPEGTDYLTTEQSDDFYAFIKTGTVLPENIEYEVLQVYYNPYE